jgi:hypothetical protein
MRQAAQAAGIPHTTLHCRQQRQQHLDAPAERVASAWFCKGEDDKNQLWVGLPHVRFMGSEGQLQQVKGADVPLSSG